MNYNRAYRQLPHVLQELIFIEAWTNKKNYEAISPHFQVQEVICPCGCQFMPHPLAMTHLELLRSNLDRAVKITSGARCESYNSLIAKNLYSDHIKGQAFDIQADSVLARDIIRIISLLEKRFFYVSFQRINLGAKHIHISILEQNHISRITASYDNGLC